MSDLIYIGGFSGGIDSQAAARFMLNRYGPSRVVLVNSDAGGNEHPLTIEHKVRTRERQVGRTFFAPCVPGMVINWIDDVVAWAKTDRGGRQNNLFRILPPPSCESRFGLCE